MVVMAPRTQRAPGHEAPRRALARTPRPAPASGASSSSSRSSSSSSPPSRRFASPSSSAPSASSSSSESSESQCASASPPPGKRAASSHSHPQRHGRRAHKSPAVRPGHSSIPSSSSSSSSSSPSVSPSPPSAPRTRPRNDHHSHSHSHSHHRDPRAAARAEARSDDALRALLQPEFRVLNRVSARPTGPLREPGAKFRAEQRSDGQSVVVWVSSTHHHNHHHHHHHHHHHPILEDISPLRREALVLRYLLHDDADPLIAEKGRGRGRGRGKGLKRHIVRLRAFVVDEERKRALLATDLCARGSADDVAAGFGCGVPERRALLVARGALAALAALHDAGVAHGDVRPRAILLSAGGDVRLTSLRRASVRAEGGRFRPLAPLLLAAARPPARRAARAAAADADENDDDDDDEVEPPRVEFAAPELIMRRSKDDDANGSTSNADAGRAPVNLFAADVWSVGISLYSLLSGRRRLGNTAWLRVAPDGSLVADVAPLLQDARIGHVTRACRALLRTLLAVDPLRRPTAARAVALCDAALHPPPYDD